MKIRLLLTFAAITLLVGASALVAQNARANQLKDQILSRDQAGEDVTSDIRKLRDYTYSHMNASVRFELSGAYQRAVESATPKTPDVNGEVYAKAQAACTQRTDSVTQTRCVQDYLAKNVKPVQPAAATAMPDKSKYLHVMSSPPWAPDLAGLTLLASVISLVLAGWFLLMRRV